MKLRRQFAQGGRGAFSKMLTMANMATVLEEECGDYRERLF